MSNYADRLNARLPRRSPGSELISILSLLSFPAALAAVIIVRTWLYLS